ncbi:unnamed protein product [Didymodactylos carnosus]|uniref:Uncharacterized protein n=1 Tax=Didymodactylos carnosus TaxID=1234261 RepID=A0A814PS51_9BILA|nr:unnamed protein product [Didymodactylos carnosus]CAF3874343.1 unnamed protein product [Didymodactylos carnosus]
MINCNNVENLTLIELNQMLLTDSSITDIYFTNNYIENLNILLNLNTSQTLVRLSYASNRIRTIDKHYFDNMQSLELLNLDYNQLESDSIRSLNSLKMLKRLYLRQAFVWSMTGPDNKQLIEFLNVIKELSNNSYLEEFHLESNKLKTIDSLWSKIDFHCLFPFLKLLFLSNNTFNDIYLQTSCPTQIMMINLISNQINSISQNGIQSLEKLKINQNQFYLLIDFNPFICNNCKTKDFIQWFRKTTIIQKNMHESDAYLCSMNQTLFDVNIDQCHQTTTTTHIQLIILLISSLSITCFILILSYFIYNWKNVKLRTRSTTVISYLDQNSTYEQYDDIEDNVKLVKN